MQEMILILLSGAFLTFLLAGILFSVFKKQLAFNERVGKFFEEPKGKEKMEHSENLKESKLKLRFQRYWDMGTNWLNKKVSKTERKRIDSTLRDAGYPFKTAIDFRLFQFVLSAALALPFILFILPIADNKMITWILAITMGLLGFRLPVFLLGKKKTARIKEINKSMPDFFDTVNLLLEAGMGLDLAIAEVSKNNKGPLSEEFLHTLEDMKLGKSRREAFYDLRKRVPSDSFQTIITSLIQADQLGIGMAKVLGNLTIRVREQRREAAREQAMKAPVKMLFPMVFFIFPALFIIILGPLVITLVTKGFGG
ncbi:type II secretion system F family protein [Neobacillus sp. PS2-9]|uniref:type II secretion system F family protein n=1 Tax=Neobacillus sp. PS2-9 TaxID=3070676 RepID=UPI0027DEFBA1|nr:type II secretion system F family protein [Neobacillus sp. PS2-9]WML59151.1 type II secretion system F family protein [Neobacillus sp. PS2-9]